MSWRPRRREGGRRRRHSHSDAPPSLTLACYLRYYDALHNPSRVAGAARQSVRKRLTNSELSGGCRTYSSASFLSCNQARLRCGRAGHAVARPHGRWPWRPGSCWPVRTTPRTDRSPQSSGPSSRPGAPSASSAVALARRETRQGHPRIADPRSISRMERVHPSVDPSNRSQQDPLVCSPAAEIKQWLAFARCPIGVAQGIRNVLWPMTFRRRESQRAGR